MKWTLLLGTALNLCGSCRPALVPEALYQADQAFVGTVLAVHRYPPSRGGGCERVAIDFAVTRVMKGSVPTRHTIFTWVNCYCVAGVDTWSPFLPHHQIAVFAKAMKAAWWMADQQPPDWRLRGDDIVHATHECSGNFLIRDSPGSTALLSLAPLLGTRPVALVSEPLVRLRNKVREAMSLFP